MRKARLYVCALAALAVAGCEGIGLLSGGSVGDGPAMTPEEGGSTQPASGGADPGHAAVGRLFSGASICSGTLVGSRSVLTAAQCVPDTTASFVLGEKSYGSTKAIKHPDYKGAVENDLAIVLLSAAPGVAPATLSAAAPTIGLISTLVGHEGGTKRSMANTVSAVAASSFEFPGAGTACAGDAGGPSFVAISGAEAMIGIHSSKSTFCGAAGTDLRVDAYRAWMVTASGGDVPAASGSQPPPPPPPPPSGDAKEGESCTSKGCASGLLCIGVYNNQTKQLLGKYCMESCTTQGSDPACEAGESCTKAPQGLVCFNPSSPQTGFTSGGSSTPPVTPPPSGPPPTGCGSTEEAQVVQLLNQERAKNGLSQLACDTGGIQVARKHSQDMCDRKYFSHYSPDGKAPWDRLRDGGVQFAAAGENIAMGYPSPEAVHNGWMSSSGHRQNMLTSSWTRVGVGMIRCGGGTPYWTEVFMR